MSSPPEISEVKQRRLNDLFAESDAATLRAIHEGKATVAEIRKYESDTGTKVDSYYRNRAATKVPAYNNRSDNKRTRGRSDSNAYDEDHNLTIPASKRQKPAEDRKPRKYVQRSTKEGCFPTCISRDSHNQQWKDRDLDMEAFQLFADEHLSSCEDLKIITEGKAMRHAYEQYCQGAQVDRILSPNVFGFCCGVMYCKTDASRKAKYHGVQLM